MPREAQVKGDGRKVSMLGHDLVSHEDHREKISRLVLGPAPWTMHHYGRLGGPQLARGHHGRIAAPPRCLRLHRHGAAPPRHLLHGHGADPQRSGRTADNSRCPQGRDPRPCQGWCTGVEPRATPMALGGISTHLRQTPSTRLRSPRRQVSRAGKRERSSTIDPRMHTRIVVCMQVRCICWHQKISFRQGRRGIPAFSMMDGGSRGVSM